jgi:hypothetical protein
VNCLALLVALTLFVVHLECHLSDLGTRGIARHVVVTSSAKAARKLPY